MAAILLIDVRETISSELVQFLRSRQHSVSVCPTVGAAIKDLRASRPSYDVVILSGRTRRICRSAVRVYVERFRGALSAASVEIGQMLDPKSVLLSEATDGNEVLYRLKASVQWCHLPLQDSTDDWSGHPWVRVGSLIGNRSV